MKMRRNLGISLGISLLVALGLLVAMAGDASALGGKMKRIISTSIVVLLCLALLVPGCAVQEVPEEASPEFQAYIEMLKEACVPEACEEEGIDFEESYINSCHGEVPDGYTLLSHLYEDFGEHDSVFPLIAIDVYECEYLAAVDEWDIWEFAGDHWVGEGGEGGYHTLISEHWKREKMEKMGAPPPAKGGEFPYPDPVDEFLLLIAEKEGVWVTLDILPKEATNYIGETHTVVATMWQWLELNDKVIPLRPWVGWVDVSVSGAHDMTMRGGAESTGTFSYVVPSTKGGTNIGDDTITATIVVNGKELTVTAHKKWISKPTPPSTPVLISPPDGAVDISLTPTLEWSPSPGATSYDIQVATDDDFDNVVFALAGRAVSLSTAEVDPDNCYYWRVRACNEDGCSAWSQVGGFYTVAAPGVPSVPTLISPSNGAVDISLTPTLDWAPSPEATSYELELAMDSSFIDVLISLTGASAISTTSYAVPMSLSYNTCYYWRVRACNEDGCSPWSVASFTSSSAPPP